jgi:hypothetical protein
MAARAARLRGSAMRAVYRACLSAIAARRLASPRALPCAAFAFSSRDDLPEQVASIRSLLATAGRPRSFTVVSDGSHDERSRRLLRRLDPCVRVADLADVVRRDLPPAVRRYAETDPMGRKLALELSLPAREPVVYADADVLFLDGAADLARVLERDGAPRFLPDCEPYLDRRIVTPAEAALTPVNGGFLVLFEPLDWRLALARLERVDAPVFHTEQTLLHLAVHASGGRALDRERYVVDTDDMRAWGDRRRRPGVALRHYTRPVRHKLWAAVAGA